MKVLIIGANGQIGKHTVRMLGLSTEHEVRAMIRTEEQRSTMEELGADEIVIGNLEEDFSHAFSDVDAVIFTAGSGAHTGKDKTESIDKDGAIKSVQEAEKANVSRFVLISSIRADKPESGPEQIQHYLRAKGAADEALQNSSLTYTVLRPGSLSNDPGKGTITAKISLDDLNSNIPREDVANVAVNALTIEETFNSTIELLTGDTAIGEALKTFK
ncbi:NAD-dependent dehydratase [Salipaludibacillus keqinensis]|uniref:NAD-dependent dehydratase n=1 Tax=Salipaludibacillus keqinensis TaxID=2045207 RepID=A0A323TK38_9BACI|nr:SDR family oxidoreductase [Salipaludibacillus keqinensis]PYZ94007.1 NAD-dependent dehydratase [Salipaludibacillus keqinensis]